MTKKKMSPSRRSKRGMRDKRYRRTEEAILEVLLKSKAMPSTGELTKRARISRSTLYRHHRAIPGIVPDYEREILNRYGRAVRKVLKREKANLRNVYLQMLIFVMNNRRVFGMLFLHSGDRVAERMVLKIVATRRSIEAGRAVRIYAKEVAGVVEDWGVRGFNDTEVDRVLKDIMYLTETAERRLGRLDR